MKRLIVLGVVVAANVAAAQDKVIEKVIKEPDRVIVRQKTTIDFSDVTLEGSLSKPEGSYAVVKKKAAFKNLVRVRDNFVPELRESVDQL